MVESSVVIYQDMIIDYSAGMNTSVEFRFEYIWGYKRKVEQHRVFQPGDLHFIHVHPPGLTAYSDLDENCLKGFTCAFGYPVLFSIIVFLSGDIHDLEHTMRSYRYSGNTMKEVPASRINTEHLVILKLLAYKGGMNEKKYLYIRTWGNRIKPSFPAGS